MSEAKTTATETKAEEIQGILDKWHGDKRPMPTTVLQIEEMLKWHYGAALYSKADIEIASRLLETYSKEVVLHYSPSDTPSNAAFSMAENLKNVFRFYSTTGDNSDIWFHDTNIGIWVPYGKDLIEEIVTRSMSQHFKSRILNEVVRIIRNTTRDRTVELGEMAPTKMVMKNGVIDVETEEFSPTFRPDDYHITALPYEYNADADCPKFEKFLKEICPLEDDRLAIVEFMGYCLVKHHDIPVFILLTGSGDNGKSTFLNIVTWMLGEKNTTAMTLQEISHDKFMKARLRSKLANICPDIPSEPIKYTGTVKTLTGKDKMTAQHKHQNSFEFRNYAKLWFSGNQIPEFNDDSDAWYKRIRPIVFPNKFTKTDKNTVVGMEKFLIKEEISGIFNFAMLGWQRMVKMGHLTGEKPAEEKAMEILKRSNSVTYFIARYCKANENSAIPVSIIYDSYNATHHYLKRKGYLEATKDPMTRGYFGKRLKDIVDYIGERQQLKVGKKVVWYYKGLEIDFDLMTEDSVTEASTLMRDVSTFTIKYSASVTNDGTEQEELDTDASDQDTPPPEPEDSVVQKSAPQKKKILQISVKPKEIHDKKKTKKKSKKTLPRVVKRFEEWLSLLPNAGQRGFLEADGLRAYDKKFHNRLYQYVEKKWLEQRGRSKVWWISDSGKAALVGGGTA